MEKVERNVGRPKLDALLQNGESETLDFKRELDLSQKRDVVELAKDMGAVQVHGGYLVLGVEEVERVPTVVGLPDAQTQLLDEARLRAAVKKYLPDPLDIALQHPDVDGKRVVLIYVGPHPDGCAVFKADGQYPHPSGKGVVTPFREGEIFTRRGTSSVRMQQADVHALLSGRTAAEPELAVGMSADAFAQAVQHLVAGGDAAKLTVFLTGLPKEAATAIKAGDEHRLGLVLDRAVDIAAVALPHDGAGAV